MTELIQSLDPKLFYAIVAFGMAMTGVVLSAGVQARRRAALIEKVDTSPIGFAQDGYVEFEGTIEAVEGKPLTAPLTGWEVCWFSAKVEEYRSHGSRTNTDSWKTVRTHTSTAPFALRDDTGVCLVRPLGAEVTPTDRSIWYGATPQPQDRNPPRLAPTQATTPMFVVEGTSAHKYRYTEERIYPGDPLFVLGQFSSGRFTAAATTAAQLDSGSDGEDDDGDAARKVDSSDQEDEAEMRAEALTRAVIKKGGGKPFILSTTSEAAHVAMFDFGSQAALYLALGGAAVLALLVYARFS